MLSTHLLHGGLLFAALDFRTLPQQIINGLLTGSIYALIALGYTMVYGILKLINFAHGEVFMLGAYTSLFVSYAFGFGPNSPLSPKANVWFLVVMIVASMAVSGLVGVLIERMAYRPLRNEARIASLITAIGMSMMLQYGGQVFLPNSPPPNISQSINPYLESKLVIPLEKKNPALKVKADQLLAVKNQDDAAWAAQQKLESGGFYLSEKGQQLRDAAQKADREYNEADGRYELSGAEISMPTGRLITIGVTVILMAILTYLVMFTKKGRAMRAVSHDFDSASLMGVNVNSIVTFTFIVGSALAGAAAMMDATLYQPGLQITSFFGLLPGVKAFVAAVLGGIGNIPGAVAGGLLMGVIEALVGWAGYTSWQDAAAFVVLIFVLLARPEGIFGSTAVEKV